MLLLRCCSPFKCNEQSDALQCYVSYVKTEWMEETEWKLFLFSMWMKNTFCFIKRWKNVLRLILYSYGKYWVYNLLLRYTLLWNTNTREWQQHGRQNTTCYPHNKLVRNLHTKLVSYFILMLFILCLISHLSYSYNTSKL